MRDDTTTKEFATPKDTTSHPTPYIDKDGLQLLKLSENNSCSDGHGFIFL